MLNPLSVKFDLESLTTVDKTIIVLLRMMLEISYFKDASLKVRGNNVVHKFKRVY